ncbi:MAG: DUF4333 domain-containing protein [Solirubrobacteraceae bacterium]
MSSAFAPRALATLLISASTALALASCGDDKTGASTPAPTTSPTVQLDTKTVAGAIKQSIKDQRDVKAKVTCPDSIVQAKGNDFVCLAKTKDGTTKFAVQQTDDAGHVTYAAAQ